MPELYSTLASTDDSDSNPRAPSGWRRHTGRPCHGVGPRTDRQPHAAAGGETALDSPLRRSHAGVEIDRGRGLRAACGRGRDPASARLGLLRRRAFAAAVAGADRPATGPGDRSAVGIAAVARGRRGNFETGLRVAAGCMGPRARHPPRAALAFPRRQRRAHRLRAAARAAAAAPVARPADGRARHRGCQRADHADRIREPRRST